MNQAKIAKVNSKIITGKVMHSRTLPTDHSFVYPVYFYAIDLDELPKLGSWLFGYNLKRIAAIHDVDYLLDNGLSIQAKLRTYLEKYGLIEKIEKIYLITSARYFNYVFNPVSFYYCYGNQGELLYVVTEINNTFKERHLYLLHQPEKVQADGTIHYQQDKNFHVSPFYPITGTYEFAFSPLNDQLDIKINVRREGRIDFYSRVWGTAVELNSINLLKTFAKFPITASLTYPRILYQAAKMYYLKKLPVYLKPKPVSEHTIYAGPATRFQDWAQNRLIKLFRSFDRGFLKVTLPDNRILFFGDSHQEPRAEIHVQHYSFFWRLIRDGAVGLGESYTEKIWETKDLTAVVNYFIANKDKVEHRSQWINTLFEKIDYLRHLLRPNSIDGAKRNIAAHYDLSNDLFKTFLDQNLMYSAGIYQSVEDSLEQAQENKVNKIIADAKISKIHHVLEIGSGWGGFAISLAQQVGCRVTSVTISKQQFELATERVREAGLENLVEIKFCDFREVTGKFDRIVSIEMLEAVGHKNYPGFFGACEKLLQPAGLVVLQIITIPDQYFERLKKRCDWIQKHIFPGSLLPSLDAMQTAMKQSSLLQVETLQNIGAHYAPTLAEWRHRFNQNIEQVKQLGFDQKFVRAWNYYLSYCEAAFATRTLNVLHLTLSRPNNIDLIAEDRANWQGTTEHQRYHV